MDKLKGLLFFFVICGVDCLAETILDEKRQRHIPVEVHLPTDHASCSKVTLCPVAFLSAGYGIAHTHYQFLVDAFRASSHLVVAVGHELPQDPPLSVSGNLFETRAENWKRGANTIAFLQESLQVRYPQYDFKKLVLAGHSNGGDISSWLANNQPERVKQVITLDHRRVPLPRHLDIEVLSIRAGDYPADSGVLPSDQELRKYPICIEYLPNARHNDMSDFGPEALRSEIAELTTEFLTSQRCVSTGKSH